LEQHQRKRKQGNSGFVRHLKKKQYRSKPGKGAERWTKDRPSKDIKTRNNVTGKGTTDPRPQKTKKREKKGENRHRKNTKKKERGGEKKKHGNQPQHDDHGRHPAKGGKPKKHLAKLKKRPLVRRTDRTHSLGKRKLVVNQTPKN